ncbi:8-amino-7-oxononanoate synthase [bacterium]|nr:8-amino-7-oxononanoate synthase [bacterium]
MSNQAHLPWLADQLAEWEQGQLRRRRRVFSPLPDGWCLVDGQRVRNFAGNDYLALAHHPQVMAAAQAATTESGTGAQGSALVCGRTPWHQRLEETLAHFEAGEAAILFPTGMAANIGTLAALIGPDDVIFCDRFNHASLVDGCRLSGAAFRVYRHQELDRLRDQLSKSANYRRRWIVTDTVFSMDGDLAPLTKLCDLAEQYDAHLMVDEAHATGVWGATGRGGCEHLGVEDRVAVKVGTLSKALGSLGGFVAGSVELIEVLWNSARTQMFSTALPPGVCAAAAQSVTILQTEPERLPQLHRLCTLFRSALAERGIVPLENSCGPIVPIVVGTPDRAVDLAARLEKRGYLVGAIRPPTVPTGTSRLRISLSLAHSAEDLLHLADAIAEEFSVRCCDPP